jgi:type IX secretion system PorP/SprF family membrane protein
VILRRIFFIILIACATPLLSQESSIIFNRYNFSVFNPAYTGIEGPAVNLNSRMQWVGVEDAPITNFLILHLPQKKNATLGFTFQNDRVYVENKTFATFDYSYKLQVSDQSNLYLGLKAGAIINNINTNKISRSYTYANPSIASLENYFSPIFGVGFTYVSNNFFFGGAIPGLINELGFNEEWAITNRDFTQLHLSGGVNLGLSDKIDIKPTISYRSFRVGPDLLNGVLEVDYNERLSLGGIFTNNNTLGGFFKIKTKKGLHLGYGYEFPSGSNNISIDSSTHEFMIRIDLRENIFSNSNSINKETIDDEN